MAQYLVQTRETTFKKGYGFLSFSKYMVKDISKNISKSFSGKYSQKTFWSC